MTDKSNHQEGGLVNNPLFRIVVGGSVFFGLFTFTANTFPYYTDQFMFFSVPIGVLGFLSFAWSIVKPENLYARFFWIITSVALFGLNAYRNVNDLFPVLNSYL